MCKISTADPSSERVQATVPDYNTDQGNGTHLLCAQLLEAGDFSSDEVLSQPMNMKSETLHAMMLTRVQHAAHVAENLAKKAKAESSSLSEAILNILDKGDVRRGAAKSDIGRAGCMREIETAMSKPGDLRFAVLTFPFRDHHPFKNVGALPDAGEAEALIRFWTIAKAISCLEVPCKVVALRDGTRYPSGWHYPIEEKRRYGDCFRDLVQALGLHEHLEVRDVDDRTEEETPEAYEERLDGHNDMYEKEMSSLLSTLEPYRKSLLAADSEAQFGKVMHGIQGGESLLPVFYSMLHGLTPSATPVSDAPYGLHERSLLMQDLLNVFSPSADEEKEHMRQTLVWEALVSTVKYVSAYRSRSAANNDLGLDEVSAVAPDALRMSIHNKSPDNGVQFPIKVGANVHRTPWHGTAEVRFSKREKSLVIDTKLAAEMWTSHVAVLPLLTSSCQDVQPEPQAAAWERYASKLADAQQPFFFADVSTLPSEWHDDKVLAQLPMPAKQGPKVREDRRMKKKTVGGA
jgi:pyoverdine/dityrosine biosynthesis protein Dit1